MDMSDLLVALRLLLFILSSLGSIETFLEELERLVEVIHVLELDGNNLIYPHQLLRDFFLYFLNISINNFLESSFQIRHSIEYVEYLLLTDSESFVSFSLTDYVFGIDTGVKALLVEVRGSFIVVESFELLGNNPILFQTFLDIVFPKVTLSVY